MAQAWKYTALISEQFLVAIAMESAPAAQRHPLPAKDLAYFPDAQYLRLEPQGTEIKNVLAARIKKLITDY